MRKKLTSAAVLLLAASTAPVSADLVVTTDLGTLTGGQYTLSGSTVGKPNNASVYSTVNNATTIAWDRGEYVYRFELTKPAFLFLTDSTEPDPAIPATETTPFQPAPDHDYFLLPSLTTFATNNTATYYNGSGKPEATSIGFVQNSMGPTTAGSAANSGIFRSAGPTATNPDNPVNPYGIYQPGTYYVSVDPRGTTTNAQREGNFFANFNVAYLDEVAKPAAPRTVVSPGSTLSGSYAAGDVKFFEIDYTGGGFRVDTQNNTLPGTDSFLALYNSEGGLVKFNDEVGQNTTDPDSMGLPFSWSRLIVNDGEIPVGTYYLGFTEYKGEANPGFNLRVFPGSEGGAGTWVINGLALAPAGVAGDVNGDGVVNLGDINYITARWLNTSEPGGVAAALSVVPEPASVAVLGLAGLAVASRRRRA